MDSTATIERSIVVAADRERVWRAITGPEQFMKWFGDPATDTLEFERLAAGEQMIFNHGGATWHGTIATVEPPQRFAFYWPAAEDTPVQTLVSFYLEPVAEGTRITITEEGFDQLPEDERRTRFDQNSEGWEIQANNLAKYLQSQENA